MVFFRGGNWHCCCCCHCFCCWLGLLATSSNRCTNGRCQCRLGHVRGGRRLVLEHGLDRRSHHRAAALLDHGGEDRGVQVDVDPAEVGVSRLAAEEVALDGAGDLEVDADVASRREDVQVAVQHEGVDDVVSVFRLGQCRVPTHVDAARAGGGGLRSKRCGGGFVVQIDAALDLEARRGDADLDDLHEVTQVEDETGLVSFEQRLDVVLDAAAL
mmetsp:Transcript_13367/g.38493  ORF Transcript_13367/g.38493 Transcript_13367/m.38493 type:complete len:214 (+) Transcript_13367:1130-1771(+)